MSNPRAFKLKALRLAALNGVWRAVQKGIVTIKYFNQLLLSQPKLAKKFTTDFHCVYKAKNWSLRIGLIVFSVYKHEKLA